MTFPVRFADEGIELADGLVWLDARKPKAIGVISHAHGDHIGRHATIICTRETAAFVRQRSGHQANYVVLAFGETHRVGDLEITLHPAGHILGAAMVHIKGPHGTLLYSGDFKLAPGRTTPGAEPVPAQTLVMEATFGIPEHRLPPPDESRRRLVEFAHEQIEAGKTPVFLAYALGKGQEVLKLLTEAGIPVAAHGSIWNLLGPYRAAGHAFPGARRLSRNGARKAAIVTPPRYLSSGPVQASGQITVASVTGWGSRTLRPGIDATIPLSDHADYDELIELVNRVQPEEVFVLHGYAAELAADLRTRGFNAHAVAGHSGPADGVIPGMFA
ncbi:MAG: MBL fold metallo-hydrolase RNA specificity domain-containing protein [Planctomycetota bacterium]